MWQDVISGDARHSIEAADCLPWLASLPEQSIDLVFGSPPYTSARSYLEDGTDLGIARNAEAWTAWMVEVTLAALRVSKGLVAWVIEGQTQDYRWDAAPFLLGADLSRRGVSLRRPCYYRRVGIPGSGGPDWFRCDAEIVLCCTKGGKLPWSDATACGHRPKWAPGGAMSHRLADGQRVNQWGMRVREDGSLTATDRGAHGDGLAGRPRKPSHVTLTSGEDAGAPVLFEGGEQEEKATGRNAFGRKDDREECRAKPHTKRRADGETEPQSYAPPVLANPGNVVQETYTAAEVDALLGMLSEFVDCKVGGGLMGSDLAHENEAPFPVSLPERFIRSFCPEGGIVADCFSGSGTTAAVSLRWNRRFVGCDLRKSQAGLTSRRIKETLNETPLFG